MAIQGSDGSIVLTTDVDTTGLNRGMSTIKGFATKIGKMFIGITAAATAATVALTKQAVSAYADYEQLVGGVETLFKNSSKKVLEYASVAYKTAGISANEYMQNVTAFSASLLNSLGGDTEKAAEVANAAIISISDNVNKMGSNYESVQNAFQGFAKQQYMLLDNLKLGYGGTKTEMERLLKDAQAITGVEYDISNLADVYTAIGVIQEKLGIAGTTALEAEKTITGSAQAMKAAWQDTLTAIAGGGAIDRAIENLVRSVETYFSNLVPVIERALQGVGSVISKIAPQLIKMLAKEIIKAIPSLINAVFEMIVGLFQGIKEGISALFSGDTIENLEIQTELIDESAENQNQLNENIQDTEKALKRTLAGFDDLNILTAGAADSFSDIDFGNISTDFEIVSSIKDAEEEIEEEAKNSGLMGMLSEFLGIDTKTIEDTFAFIRDNIFKDFFDYVKNDFVPGIKRNFNDLGLSLGTIWKTIKEPFENFYNDTLKPIADDFKLWTNNLIDDVSQFFRNIGEEFVEHEEDIEELIEGISFMLQTLWAVISPILDAISTAFGPVTNNIIDFVFDIIQIFGNLFSFFGNFFSALKALFTGNWEELGARLKEGLFDLGNIVVGILNAIIHAINTVISGITSLFGIDDWQIPEIPRIEEWFKGETNGMVGGGFVGAFGNPSRGGGGTFGDAEPYMANMSAEKSNDTYDAFASAFEDALAKFEETKIGSSNAQEIVLELDGRELGRAVVEQGTRESYRAGTKLLVK